jgi:hypothetical protein
LLRRVTRRGRFADQQVARVAQVLQGVARRRFQAQGRAGAQATRQQGAACDLGFARFIRRAATEQDEVGRRMFAAQEGGPVQARGEVGVDLPARRVLAEQQDAIAVFGHAGSPARHAQHVQEIAHVHQARAEGARGERDQSRVQDVPVGEQAQAMGDAGGHGRKEWGRRAADAATGAVYARRSRGDAPP